MSAATWTPLAAEGLNVNQQRAFDIYKELIEINTVTATGDTAQAAEAMAARLRAGGFPEADVHAFSISSRASGAPAGANRSCWSLISTWFPPAARTGRPIRSS